MSAKLMKFGYGRGARRNVKSRTGTLKRIRQERPNEDGSAVKTVMVTAEEHALLSLIK